MGNIPVVSQILWLKDLFTNPKDTLSELFTNHWRGLIAFTLPFFVSVISYYTHPLIAVFFGTALTVGVSLLLLWSKCNVDKKSTDWNTSSKLIIPLASIMLIYTSLLFILPMVGLSKIPTIMFMVLSSILGKLLVGVTIYQTYEYIQDNGNYCV